MSHELFRWLHLVTFAVWFGTDLGVFAASRVAADGSVPVAGRRVAVRLMLLLDLLPRFALLAVAALGPLLAAPFLGLTVPTAVAAGWVLAVTAWSVLVMRLHTAAASSRWAKRADVALRMLLVAACIAGIARHAQPATFWLAAKAALFATAIVLGLVVRRTFAPFVQAFGQLVATGSDAALERTIRTSMAATRRLVLLIYACVLGAAWFGVAKPVWPWMGVE